MKKLLIVPVICTVLAGCTNVEDDKENDTVWTCHGKDCATKVVTIEGHKYIIMDGFYSGNIVHAASCDCQAK